MSSLSETAEARVAFLLGLSLGVTATAITTSLVYSALGLFGHANGFSSASSASTRASKSRRRRVPRKSLLDLASLKHELATSPNLDADSTPNPQAVERLKAMFTLPVDRLQIIMKQMLVDMKKGLDIDGRDIKMLPTFVTNRPTGKETGSYLAIDFGGTNLRVCEVILDGTGATPKMLQSKFVISDAVRTGSGVGLFDFIAECVKIFLADYHPEITDHSKANWKLGFTFSYPVDQTSINSGDDPFLLYKIEAAVLSFLCSLITWTKGFTCTGVVGVDAVKLLEDAFTRIELPIKVAALVNDTTGTLMSHGYSNPNTYAGVILGTGSNCAYVEKVANITKFLRTQSDGGASFAPNAEMLINMEWGSFDDAQVVIPRTKYDHELDRATPLPGSYTFEQLISGRYLGEIVRLVLVDLARTGDVFAKSGGGGNSGGSSVDLHTMFRFETSFMSRIERDYSYDLSDVRDVLEGNLKCGTTTLADRRLVKTVCELVGMRSARLAATGVAAVVTKMNRLSGCTVGVDGSLFEYYPHYKNRMMDAMREILGISSENIVLEQARDGSGQGAALIAALA
ncbi:hexokinase A [Entophlyctis luteolus]|nr:hexokinase A [Entophlyctis luteolus]